MTDFKLWYIIANISNKCKINLLKEYKTEENIYNIFCKSGKNLIYRNENISERFKLVKDKDLINLQKYLLKNKIKYITITDTCYPNELRCIENPPYVIFYKGNFDLIKTKKVAIIGARKCTNYGSEVCKLISRELAKLGVTVVSGLADGIDSYAHKEVLKHRGNTIGVLGCGIDVIYPKKNYSLYSEMEKCGLILSEFLPKTLPVGYNFPRRNRIISGLSESIIIIEASEKSGSLITANYALEQGKEILAVPGGVFNEKSKGCNRLIADGAIPFNDLLDLYVFVGKFPSKIKDTENNNIKESILKVISDRPRHLDFILENVEVDKEQLFKLLFEMQKLNQVICLPGNYYAKIS